MKKKGDLSNFVRGRMLSVHGEDNTELCWKGISPELKLLQVTQLSPTAPTLCVSKVTHVTVVTFEAIFESYMILYISIMQRGA